MTAREKNHNLTIMRFLHSGDWHLGKTLYDVSLEEDQKQFMEQVHEIFGDAKREGKPYDALIIPGDIYDRNVPPAKAVSLLDDFLGRMSRDFPEAHVFILSGNHDGPARLGFASSFLEKSNIHIATDAAKTGDAVMVSGVAVYQIPFLLQTSFPDEETRTQQRLFERATEIIRKSHAEKHPGTPAIVCAHATVYGKSDGEHFLSVGTASSIDRELFSGFTYTALGHIHKYQQLGENGNIFYSGSPLAYSFDDNTDKCFLSVEIGTDTEKPDSVERIPVRTLHPLIRLSGKFSDFIGEDAHKKWAQYRDCYVEIKCTDSTLSENPKRALLETFPRILSFVRERSASGGGSDFEERRKLAMKQGDSEVGLFRKFVRDMHPEDDHTVSAEQLEEEIALFAEAIGEMRNGGAEK